MPNRSATAHPMRRLLSNRRGLLAGAAALFAGNVTITGSLTVQGSYPKSAAVKKRGGTLARMYCQEAPEPWFEDFGTATLTNGRAEIALDADFDQVVKGDDYLIFTMSEGDCTGLFVSRKGPHRFVVEELQGGKSTLPFSYRVVARRLDDVGTRMEKVEPPKLPPLDIERLTRGVGNAPAEPPRQQLGAR